MSRSLNLYQYLAPAILAPLSAWLWWREYGNLPQMLTAWLIPVAWAYLVPGIGTNVLKVWEFDTALRLGRFRPHHGFVFGSVTATLAWLLHGAVAQSIADVARSALILASVLGFWNLLYDIKALRAGILKVYNQPWARGADAEAVAMDYAPWFFGGFGCAYGAAIAGLEYLVSRSGMSGATWALVYLLAAFAVCVALPVLGFICRSLRTHGHAGTRPVAKNEHA